MWTSAWARVKARPRRSRPAWALLAVALTLAPHGEAVADEAAAWAALRAGGVAALVRHARAPGVGDPPGFRLDDPATQRNLSEDGREQARALGRRFAREGVVVSAVLSSRWARALDTARLAFPAVAVEPEPALDSFFEQRGEGPARTAALRRLLAERSGRPGALVLVTHQVNVTALTGLIPAEGEVLVIRSAGERLHVVGRVRP